MSRLAESRSVFWLSAAIVTAAHAAILFAWHPSSPPHGMSMDEESNGVVVELVSSVDSHSEDTSALPEEPEIQELHPQDFVENLPPEPTPHETTPEPIPEVEPQPTPVPTPPPVSRPEQKKAPAKPAAASRQAVPGASRTSDGPSGSPHAIATMASFAKRPVLTYPPASRQAREEGTVIVRITVDSQGRPTGVTIVKSSGYSGLDRAAIEGAWRCRIRNAKEGMVLDVPLRFNLDG